MNYNGISIGTVSHGSLRPQDLIPAFAEELENILNRLNGTPPEAHVKLVVEARDWQPGEDAPEEEGDEPQELINDLLGVLNDYAPPYCTFGAREGDGSDFGWWPNVEAAQEATHDGDVVEINTRHKNLPDYLLEINERGNCTLYRIVLEEVWGVV